MPDVNFIKLNRRITKWGWYSDANTFRVFMHILLSVNWKDGHFMGHEIKAGSVPTGYPSIASALGLTVQNVRTAIKHLKTTGEVTVKVTSKFSVITLVNWDKYQVKGKSNSQANSQLTASQQSANSQLTPIEEVKNIRSKERTYNRASRFDDFWSCYPKKKSKGQAEAIWKRKNLGNGSFDLIMKGLEAAKRSDEWHKDGGKFIPYPATWLNAKGWEDEYEESAAQIDYLSGVLNA